LSLLPRPPSPSPNHGVFSLLVTATRIFISRYLQELRIRVQNPGSTAAHATATWLVSCHFLASQTTVARGYEGLERS
jgi:hypothetical protein